MVGTIQLQIDIVFKIVEESRVEMLICKSALKQEITTKRI